MRRASTIVLGVFALAILGSSRNHPEAKAQSPSLPLLETPRPPPPPDDTAPIPPSTRWLKVGIEEHPVILFTPSLARGETKPVIVMLHGMCDTPENECRAFSAATSTSAFLLCPRANGACGNGGAMWRGSPQAKRTLIDDALARVASEYPQSTQTDHDVTLVGFSQGAYLALDMVTRERGPWTSLILIGASVDPDPRALLKANIRRVVLASGDYDGAKPAMQRAAARLVDAGVDARFKSLGPVGHQFAFDMNAWMRAELDWVRQDVASR